MGFKLSPYRSDLKIHTNKGTYLGKLHISKYKAGFLNDGDTMVDDTSQLKHFWISPYKLAQDIPDTNEMWQKCEQ